MENLAFILISAILAITNGLNDDLIGFEFLQQQNGSADLLQIPVSAGESSQAGLSLCFRVQLKFWDLKCLFNAQSNMISMAMPNYKKGFVR